MRADADVLILGAGHGGLAVAHDLVRAGRDVLLVDAHVRVGDAWRTRWDSLRLFTPRELDALPGIPFPAGDDPFPNKDEVADYQERYASELGFPIRLGAAVRDLRRHGGVFEAKVGEEVIRARSVVIAGGHYHAPRIPDLAARLDPAVLQLHSRDYRRAQDLPVGPVVVVGAANSGGEIAVEVARHRPTTIAIGTRRPLPPGRWRSPNWWKLALLRDRLFHERTATVGWLPWPLRAGGYLEADLDRAAAVHGLRLASRAVDAAGDTLRLAGGGAAPARTVIWATGYRAEHSWIDVPKEDGVVVIGRHGRGPVPGLHFVRGRFLFAISRHARDVARDIGHEG
ncbi:MAG TPA: NAD(P)-binding domain-containing protein [Candidatus Limnocylindria bacterium]|nr:NAD(P)-binding domain-containing protein [Candidatus Limnocylindria bacterium]